MVYSFYPTGWLVSQKFPGDTARVGVLRDGKELELDVQVMQPNPLVPHHLNGKAPSFLIVGGLIFTILTGNYLYT